MNKKTILYTLGLAAIPLLFFLFGGAGNVLGLIPPGNHPSNLSNFLNATTMNTSSDKKPGNPYYSRTPKDPLRANTGIIPARGPIIVPPAVLNCFAQMPNLPANAVGPVSSSRSIPTASPFTRTTRWAWIVPKRFAAGVAVTSVISLTTDLSLPGNATA